MYSSIKKLRDEAKLNKASEYDEICGKLLEQAELCVLHKILCHTSFSGSTSSFY